MKHFLLSAFFFLSVTANAQCGREYPSGFYHNSQFISPKGDTLNKLDNEGFYEGIHVYTDDKNNAFTETNSYVTGSFHHGLPVGEWKDHCNDGSYSTGQFECGGGESKSDGKGGWIDKKQGIYSKTGVWKYYDRNNKLVETNRYDRLTLEHGWCNKTYTADSAGNFILTKLESKTRYQTKWREEITRTYYANGTRATMSIENFWKDISIDYYPNGKPSEKFRCKKFMGIKKNRSVTKSYSETGKVTKKKGKCWTRIVDPEF